MTYFWIPFVVALVVYFAFISYKAINQSLDTAVKKKSDNKTNETKV